MRKHTLLSVFVVVVLLSTLLGSALPAGVSADSGVPTNLTWAVQYMIDQSQTVLGNSQFTAPRNNRGLALSPDGRYAYLGYNSGFGADGEVRKIDLTAADYTNATVARTTVSRGKAIAVDDQGRVYLAEGAAIKIMDADLAAVQHSLTATKCEGVAVTREGGVLVAYATERGGLNTLTRWVLTESGGAVTGAVKAGLDGDGVITVAGATDIRGVAVDTAGRIWIADPHATYDPGKVFRVNNDGTGLVSNAAVPNPYAIAFYGDQVLVSGGYSRVISVLNAADLSIASTLTPPWATLELDPDGNGNEGALMGIAMAHDGNGFYVTNESGQTADAKSTYGRTDAESGDSGGKFYTDLTHDDNDPLLRVYVPVATVDLSASETTFCDGGATVEISINDVADLYGYQFKVSYDDSKVSAVGAFENGWFDTSLPNAAVVWDGSCASGECAFAVSKVDPSGGGAGAVSGSGTVARITLTALQAGTFDVSVSDVVLTDVDGFAIPGTVADPLALTVECWANVSGKVKLQGRLPAAQFDAGNVRLTGGTFGPYDAATAATDGSWSQTVPVDVGGTLYTLFASHSLYLGNQTTYTMMPGANVVDDTRLKGGDVVNADGLLKVTIADISAIAGDPRFGTAVAQGISPDINADGMLNIQDLAIAGGNFDLVTPQAW